MLCDRHVCNRSAKWVHGQGGAGCAHGRARGGLLSKVGPGATASWDADAACPSPMLWRGVGGSLSKPRAFALGQGQQFLLLLAEEMGRGEGTA